MPKTIDLKGKQFGKLTVLKKNGKSKNRHCLWLCLCECGNETTMRSDSLRSGDVKSCGCYKIEKATTHGLRKTKLYRLWAGIKNRCYNKNEPTYKNYGGRGIKVCSDWFSDARAFCEWARANGWKPGLTIDRVDNDGDYTPSNCRFVTHAINSRNTRSTRIIKYQDQAMCISEWARFLGMRVHTLWHRLNRGWSVERALTTPVNHQRKGELKT